MLLNVHSGTVRVGECYSGLLRRDPQVFLRSIALATPEVARNLQRNHGLNRSLQGYYERKEDLNIRYLDRAGIQAVEYTGLRNQVSWGLSMGTPRDEQILGEARELLRSLKEGIHRKVFFALMGIDASHIIDLPVSSYAALLAKLYGHFNRTLQSIHVVNSTTDQFSISKGRVNIEFSKDLLKTYPFWAFINETFDITDPSSA